MGHSGTVMDSVGRVLNHLGALTWATRPARTRGGQNAVFVWRGMENVQVSGYSDGLGSAVCKTVGLAYVGSNPTPATRNPSSEPLARDCVSGSCAQEERFRRPLAVGCGPYVGQIRVVQSTPRDACG
jgi:hypothetical protein